MLKPGGMPTRCLGVIRLSIKKRMFPEKRVAFFFFTFFFGRNKLSIFGKKRIFAKRKKKSPVAPFLATRPVYQKHNYLYGQPKVKGHRQSYGWATWYAVNENKSCKDKV